MFLLCQQSAEVNIVFLIKNQIIPFFPEHSDLNKVMCAQQHITQEHGPKAIFCLCSHKKIEVELVYFEFMLVIYCGMCISVGGQRHTSSQYCFISRYCWMFQILLLQWVLYFNISLSPWPAKTMLLLEKKAIYFSSNRWINRWVEKSTE